MTDSSDLPIGPVIIDPVSARRPVRFVLHGRLVDLVPLDPLSHGESLFQLTCGTDKEHLWTYLLRGPFSGRKEFDAYLQQLAASEDPMCFVIVDRGSARALGWATYMRIEPAHRVIEVGNIMFSPVLRRTAGATEAIYLMARNAFEALGYRRLEWKCNALNAASRRAALRFGFSFEGIFRQHMIVKGHSRDTAWFSIIDAEWPNRKEAFETWLQPSNFDEEGRQKTSLSALNGVA
jgi:RimJ/RimL family protein N-acetyltransferase